MKKLFVLPLILMGSGLFAQKYQLGLKAGVNVSNTTGASFNNVSKKAFVGFNAGAFLSFLIGNNFAIQPEVLISSQGFKINDGQNSGNYKASYLTVPVLAKYRFNGGFYLEAGPQVGFKLNESVPNNSIKDFAKNLDVSVDAGLGYHSNMGLGVGARYCLGVSKVGNFDEAVGNGFDPSFKYTMVQVFVFYTLFNNHRDH